MKIDIRPIHALIFFTSLSSAAPAGAAGSTPPDPFIDKGTCPFECCVFRDWKTNAPVTLVDKPNGSRTIATIAKGTTVTGLTGDDYVSPVRLVATHAFDDSPIRKGAIFYALHPGGEGFWSVWYKGKVYSVDFSAEPNNDGMIASANPHWWVKIRTRDGKIGWALDSQQFDNQDSCG